MSLDYSSDDESIIDATNVQLGFVDVEIENTDDVPTIEDTILGGEPVWLHPSSLPDEKLVTCDNCGKKMALLLQAFSPFKDALYDRVIYIFGCKQTLQCSRKKGSIKAIRGIIKDPVKIAKLKEQQQKELQNQIDEKLRLEEKTKLRDELTKDLFGKSGSPNPFAKSDNPFGNPFSSNPFDKKEEQPPKEEKDAPKKDKKEPKTESKPSYSSVLTETIPPKTTSKPSYTLPAYPGYFVYVEKEKLKKITVDSELEKYKDIIDNKSVDEELGSPSVANPLTGQAAKISSMLEDKVFENFSNTVQHNASQILRYDLGGRPLLYNGKDEICKKFSKTPFNISNPGYNPSSSRQFELQLMPKAILDLERSDDANINDILNGIEWGTVIVCTDVEDYIPEEYYDENHAAYVEEYCAVQWEESV